MSELINFLSSVDDDYLIGLSNKGIVKRSYKDLEKDSVELSPDGTECIGKIGDVDVTLRMPLTESSCSCPAHGICKHIIMTIIELKKNASELPDDVRQGNDDYMEKVSSEKTPSEKAPSEKAKLHFPSIVELKKNISNKEFASILEELMSNNKPEINEGSMITVKDKATGTTVKLAFPIELSTCSCHSEKLCRHKVKAILSLQIKRGEISKEQLTEFNGELLSKEWDEQGIKAVLVDVRSVLNDIILTGASRMSPELPEALERYAIRCHSVLLADMEEKLRVLSEMTAAYQGRKAKVNAAAILNKVSEIYILTDMILKRLSNGEDISDLAGSFRSEYQDVSELHLTGMGMRHFVSDTGYEGDTVYFLEDSGQWYTYTVARPTIYDNKKRRGSYNEAPWGLPCNLQKLSGLKIVLNDGKVNSFNRLSSTSKASAYVVGESDVSGESVSEHIYNDFSKLCRDYIDMISNSSESEKLFLVKPEKIFDMNYDEVSQQLSFYMEDGVGRTLCAKLTYSTEEADAIKSLERMKRNIEKNKKKVPVFLGIIYIENGECVMYPIETFE